jgi:hypothetical protein
MIRGILAAFVIAWLLVTSVLAAACDLSCAFTHTPSNCDSPGMKTEVTQLGTPNQMGGAHHSHDGQEPGLGQVNLETNRISRSMGLCEHEPCTKPATLSNQETNPTSPRLGLAVLINVSHVQPNNFFVVMLHFGSGAIPRSLSVFDRFSTHLRI